MDKFAVFIKYYSIGKSSPVLCLLDLLSDTCEVDLFIQDASCVNATVLARPAINIISLDAEERFSLWQKAKRFWKKSINARSGKKSTSFSDIEYKGYICFDPHAFILCKELFPAALPIYYSLELYLRTDHFNLPYPLKEMARERKEISTIRGLIIQSREREQIFRQEYALSNKIPSFILPVTYVPASVNEKSDMLRHKYNIDRDTKIALHLGGIQEYFSCIELAVAFSKVEGWALIFHGYHFGSYIDTLRAAIADRKLNNIFISTDTYELLEDMDSVVMSCDMGIAWYNDVSINFTTAGKSSGKISAYLRFGLPVLAKKYPSTVDALESTGCGVCVDDFSMIPDAVRKIEGNYPFYSDNCRKEYDNVYWFENYRAKLLEFIECSNEP